MVDKTVYAIAKVRPSGRIVPVAICELEITANRRIKRTPDYSVMEIVIQERPNGTLIGPVSLVRPNAEDLAQKQKNDADTAAQIAADAAIAKALAAGLTQADIDAIEAGSDLP